MNLLYPATAPGRIRLGAGFGLLLGKVLAGVAAVPFLIQLALHPSALLEFAGACLLFACLYLASGALIGGLLAALAPFGRGLVGNILLGALAGIAFYGLAFPLTTDVLDGRPEFPDPDFILVAAVIGSAGGLSWWLAGRRDRRGHV